jgi:hypothetical protein
MRERHRHDRKFKEWYENRHEYQRDCKERTGKKMVGFFCTYEPEEIFYAFDILPWVTNRSSMRKQPRTGSTSSWTAWG